MAEAHVDWQARPEAGSSFGMRLLIWIAGICGRRVLHWILLPVSGYFLVLRGPERRASRAYLSRVFERPATLLECWRHFFAFARMSADRIFFLSGQADRVPVTFVGGPEAQAIVDGDQRGLFLAAHLGSFEAARVLGEAFGGMDLRIVLDQQQGARVASLAAELNPELGNKIIDAGRDSVALGLAIGEALREGSWVGFLADRHRAGDRTLAVPFLGQPAAFPVGPYLIASTFKAPMICAFCRLTKRGYEVHCEVLSERVALDRRDRNGQLEALLRQYVARLEVHVRASPYAWFNFYDFWSTADAAEV